MQPQQPAPVNPQSQGVLTIGEWMITLLIAAIPLVGFIMLFVWAFGGNTNVNKANWAKATLIWFAIILGLYLLIAIFFGLALLSSR